MGSSAVLSTLPLSSRASHTTTQRTPLFLVLTTYFSDRTGAFFRQAGAAATLNTAGLRASWSVQMTCPLTVPPGAGATAGAPRNRPTPHTKAIHSERIYLPPLGARR